MQEENISADSFWFLDLQYQYLLVIGLMQVLVMKNKLMRGKKMKMGKRWEVLNVVEFR